MAKKQIFEKQAREIILHVYGYFELECQNNGPLLPVQRVRARAAAAAGVSPVTVGRIVQEKYGKSGMEDNELKTPSKKRRRRRAAEKDQAQNSKDLNSANDDVPNISTNTSITTNAPDKINAPKTNENAKKPRKRKPDESETFTVDELLNYGQKNSKPASVKQDSAVNCDIAVLSASNTEVVKDISERCNQIDTNQQLPKVPNKILKESVFNVDKVSNYETIIDNPSDATTPNTLMNNTISTEQNRVNKLVLKDTCDDIDCELKSFKIYKEEAQPVISESVGALSLPMSILPEKEIPISPVLGHRNKSIAKADFKIGRIKMKNSDTDTDIGIPHDINIELIKDHVRAYHTRNEIPTIKTMMISLRDSGLFFGSRETLLQILKKIGLLLKKPTKN